MRKKNALWMCLVTLLLFNVFVVQVGAPQTVISVDPKSYTAPGIGVTFTINVKIADVNDLYGFDYQFYWDPTILDLVQIKNNIPWPEGQYFLAKNDTSVPGRYWLAVSGLAAEPFSGSIVLSSLTFEVTGIGSCVLDLVNTKLADSKADPIPHSVEDGFFTFGSAPPAQRTPFSPVNVVIVILVAIFFVAALYYLKKRIS